MYIELAQKVLERMKNIAYDQSFAHVYNPEFAGAGRFQWSTGVGLYGAWKLFEATGDQDILAYLEQWFQGHFQKGLPGKNVNTACPLLTLAYLYEHTGKQEYLEVCIQWAAWLYEKLPRTQEGGFVHLTGAQNNGQLWMDTLFMSVLFLAKMGVILDRSAYIREAEKQIILHTKYLIDTSTGLFFHGYNFNNRSHFSGALWGRGNGWYAAAVPELLEIARGRLETTAEDIITESFKTQMGALLRYQDAGGMWRTLLDDETSYLESSGTAAFAYGMLKGREAGILDGHFAAPAEKAVHGIVERIAGDGTVLDASGGTPIFETLEEYKNVVKVPIVYGQGLAIMLLTQCEKQL